MYSDSNIIEIFRGSNTNEVIDRLFNTMPQRLQEAKETSFERGSKFMLENVDSLYYYFQKIDTNTSGSYIDSPDWIKNKKTTINPKNKDDDECFRYTITAALNHQSIENRSDRILNP